MKTLICALLAVTTLVAQTGPSIAGSVLDSQGQHVPDVTLTLFSPIGGAVGTTTSNATGAYRFPALTPGHYLLRASARGFALFVSDDILINSGASTNYDISLEIARVHDQVVITAASTPQLSEHVSKDITVISASDIDNRDSAALSDILATTAGLHVQQLGGPGTFTTIQMRGLPGYDTAILVDGLRLRDASAAQADAAGFLDDLLPADTSQVEILRGSGSSLYGSNAIGGVINIITDSGGGRTRGSLLLEGGSLGTFRGRAQLAGGLHHDQLQYSLGLTETDVTSGLGGDVPFRNLSTQSSVTLHLSPSTRLTARLFAADAFAKVQGEPDTIGSFTGLGIVNATSATFLPAPDNPDSTRAVRFLSAALIWNQQLTPTLDYTASYQLVTNGRRYGDGPAGAGYQPISSTLSRYDGHIQTANLQAHYRPGRFNLITAGYEFENENYANDNSQQYFPANTSAVNVTQLSHTAFVQDQAHFFGDRLQLSGAFRSQFFAVNNPTFAPMALAPYQGIALASPPAAYTGDGSAAYFFRKTQTKLRTHLGRGYRAPSLYERFGAGFDPVYGYTVYGDPRLTPEHSTSFDVGFDQTFFHQRLKASASYFYTWIENIISFDSSGLINPVTDPYGRFLGYLNSKGGISRGLEASATLAPIRKLNITTAYTYLNALQRSPLVGNVLETFIAPHNQFSLVATEQATSKLLLTLDTLQSGSYLAPIFSSSTYVTQTFRFNGLHKLNLGASYRIPLQDQKALRLFVRGNNIFNQTYYESGYASPGRTALAGLQLEF